MLSYYDFEVTRRVDTSALANPHIAQRHADVDVVSVTVVVAAAAVAGVEAVADAD